MNKQPSPEFEKEIRETLGAPSANPAFVRDLRETLLERSTMKNQTRTLPRLAWGFAIALVLFGLLSTSPQIAEAMKRVLGFIPGIGYVEPGNSLRILSAPVTAENDGVTITIEEGTADSQRTILLERIEGVIPNPSEDTFCMGDTQLVLDDGTGLSLMGYESVHEGGKDDFSSTYHGRYVFEALPPQTKDATLEIRCLLGAPTESDFNIRLHFQDADENQVLPVIELPTASAPQPAPATASVSSAESQLEGFSIMLESETSLTDGYIISGSYQWTDERFNATTVFVNEPQITDANGHQVLFEAIDPATAFDPSAKKVPFAFQINGKDHVWPLTITVSSIALTLHNQGTFDFDAGTDPQVGQIWDVNIDVPVDTGDSIHVQTIKLIEGRTPTQLGFEFTMTSNPPIMGASINDINPIITSNSESGGGGGGGGGGGSNSPSPFSNSWVIEGYSPAGMKTFIISDLTIMITGSWQVEWQPSAQ